MHNGPVVATCKFDLVPVSGALDLDKQTWERVQFNLYEFQPAKKVRLVAGLAPHIRVVAYGTQPDVAPGLLARLEELTGTALRVEAGS